MFKRNEIQTLAVWGSPYSGKTLTSVRIARALADRGADVILVLTDVVSPMIPVLFPLQGIHEDSLGALMTGGEITQDKILGSCTFPGREEHFSLIGYHKGENVCTYADYTRERAVDFLVLLRHLAQYVIIDCSSILSTDMLSHVALETADKVLRLGSCDLKSISYFASQLTLFMDRRYRCESHIKVLSDVQSDAPRQEMAESMGGVDAEIPHVMELQEMMQSGRLFESLKTREGRLYETGLLNLIKAVFTG